MVQLNVSNEDADELREAVAYDPDTGTYSRRSNWTDGETPSLSVAATVAAATETPVEQLRPLAEVIDTDALDRIFAPSSGAASRYPSTSVSFRYEGCHVTVYADGRTVVFRR
jgi:hypothetical protein